MIREYLRVVKENWNKNRNPRNGIIVEDICLKYFNSFFVTLKHLNALGLSEFSEILTH